MAKRTQEQKLQVRERRVGRLERRWWGQVAISAFILWHFFAVAIWLIPNSALQRQFQSSVRDYMVVTGLMQGWNMFAPNPEQNDRYVSAKVTYADGTVKNWDFPRMAKMGYVERYREERWRKFLENAHLESNSLAWPSLARYAARVNHADPKNPPAKITLTRHWRKVPDPNPNSRTPTPLPPFQSYDFHTQAVTSEDLR